MTAANATIHDYGHTIEVDVQDGTYHVNRVLLFTPEEAEEFRVWFNEAAKYSPQPPYVARLFLGTVAAIARNREYGGH